MPAPSYRIGAPSAFEVGESEPPGVRALSQKKKKRKEKPIKKPLTKKKEEKEAGSEAAVAVVVVVVVLVVAAAGPVKLDPRPGGERDKGSSVLPCCTVAQCSAVSPYQYHQYRCQTSLQPSVNRVLLHSACNTQYRCRCRCRVRIGEKGCMYIMYARVCYLSIYRVRTDRCSCS